MSDDSSIVPYEKTVETATRFLEKLVGPSLEETGLMIQDNVRLWRVKNQIRILNKAQEYCAKKGINPKQIPIKTLVPLLEYGSLEENPKIQEKWASLLAHASESPSNNNIISSYAQILNQLSSKEVVILDRLFLEYLFAPQEKRAGLTFGTQKVCSILQLSEEEFKIILGNLTRLHILQSPASHGGVKIGSYPIVMRTDEAFQFTALGCDFIRTCKNE